MNEDLANIHDIGGKPASVSAPREHPFVLQSVGGQTLTVFTESSSGEWAQNHLSAAPIPVVWILSLNMLSKVIPRALPPVVLSASDSHHAAPLLGA